MELTAYALQSCCQYKVFTKKETDVILSFSLREEKEEETIVTIVRICVHHIVNIFMKLCFIQRNVELE